MGGLSRAAATTVGAGAGVVGEPAGTDPIDALPAQHGGLPPRRATVLIVDDEPDQLDLLCAYFRRAGCEVFGAPGAAQALRVATEIPIELFVVDLRLPGMNGWRLAETLRQHHRHGRVAICSVLDPQDYPPADDVLPKPFTRAQIVALLDRQLTERDGT